MASVRKKYRDENGADKDAPVATAPQAAAAQSSPASETPTPAETPKPAEPEAERNPVEQAAQSALRDRLHEMENAERSVRETPQQPEESFAREPQQQPQQRPVTMEQIIADSQIPERAKAWLRQHPEYMTDSVKNARIAKMHYVAEHQAGGEYTDSYFERLEELLGLRQQTKPTGNGIQNSKPAAQRQSAPSPQRQSGVSPQVSAPPKRQSPSMTTGRTTGQPTQLTAEELTLSRALKITPEEYAENKQKMIALKNAGVIQDGR
jgi:hypothetical protein